MRLLMSAILLSEHFGYTNQLQRYNVADPLSRGETNACVVRVCANGENAEI